MTGCSSKNKAESPTAAAPTQVSAGGVSASVGAGTAKVTIDGQPKDVNGQVVCSTVGGNLNLAIGEAGTGIAVVMSPDASKVTSVGLGNINGTVLGFQDGAPGGNAAATVDGKNYKVTGTASGVDMANPMQPITKPFEIEVTCP
jgi:lipoprotein LpqH